MTWHLDQTAADRYVHGGLDTTSEASIEAHLLQCEHCRGFIGQASDPVVLADLWAGVVDALDQPELSLVERALIRAGVSDHAARTLAATAGSRLSYLIAVLVSVLFALVAAASGKEELMGAFLFSAPLGPLLATVAAFSRRTDRSVELFSTFPTPSLQLLLVRLVATVAPAIALIGLASIALVPQGWDAVIWLLPALALALGTLALSNWMPVESAALRLGAVWLALPLVLRIELSELPDLLRGPVQLVFLAAVIVAGAITASRAATFDLREA